MTIHESGYLHTANTWAYYWCFDDIEYLRRETAQETDVAVDAFARLLWIALIDDICGYDTIFFLNSQVHINSKINIESYINNNTQKYASIHHLSLSLS